MFCDDSRIRPSEIGPLLANAGVALAIMSTGTDHAAPLTIVRRLIALPPATDAQSPGPATPGLSAPSPDLPVTVPPEILFVKKDS